MNIQEIYPDVLYDHIITMIGTHSQTIKPGGVFLAITGHEHDGHHYIKEAIANGASTVILENIAFQIPVPKVNYIIVNNSRKELAILSKRFYAPILQKISFIGITGTTGKTTVSTLLFRYLRLLGIDSLLIGSNGNMYNDIIHETNNTTPDLLTIYQMIERYYDKLRYVIMEISSQAIRELRVLGVEFNLVLVTNISQDHFDYHPNWEDYVFSKGILLIGMEDDNNHHIILNRESTYYRFFDNLTIIKSVSFGLTEGDYYAEILEENLQYTRFNIVTKYRKIKVVTYLVGRFNVENILAFYSIIDTMGFDTSQVGMFLNSRPIVQGRMERYEIKMRTVIIDYAHTPEAVKAVLSFLRTRCLNKLLVVIGCGGRRDRKKRPLMAEYSLEFGDFVYFTEDNSRGEPFKQIIDDMLQNTNKTNFEVIQKREEAVIKALRDSEPQDMIVLVGMGYDKYACRDGWLSDYDLMIRWKEEEDD